MPPSELCLLDINNSAVVAPAGCGKTQLIANALVVHAGPRPVMILTHTNAGVAALRARLTDAGVPSRRYRLSTIDGWALRLGSLFPVRSGLCAETLTLRHPARDYPEIRKRALGLLASGHIAELLRTTYARVLVDEYQDCSRTQHALVQLLSGVLPVVVLGDPMQAIFDFGEDGLAQWKSEVCSCFPEAATLNKPWRWLNAGEGDLGSWLLDMRARLQSGLGIDLETGPQAVHWVRLHGGRHDYAKQLHAAQMAAPVSNGTVLILADSTKPQEHRRFASQIPGASTVEAVDLKDFVSFADALDLENPFVLQRVVQFAQSVMTNVGAEDLISRIAILERGAARKAPSAAESAARRFKGTPSAITMAELLEALNKQGGVRVYRPVVLRACFQALRQCSRNSNVSFGDAARRVREEYRAGFRTISKRAVGSTLLLKGLEADMSVILDADGMNARHLYVAMTRGARRLVVCARSSQMRPAA